MIKYVIPWTYQKLYFNYIQRLVLVTFYCLLKVYGRNMKHMLNYKGHVHENSLHDSDHVLDLLLRGTCLLVYRRSLMTSTSSTNGREILRKRAGDWSVGD